MASPTITLTTSDRILERALGWNLHHATLWMMLYLGVFFTLGGGLSWLLALGGK